MSARACHGSLTGDPAVRGTRPRGRRSHAIMGARMSEANPRRRLVVIGLIVVALFAGLLTRLWFLQVAGGEDLAVAAQDNGDKIVQIPAIRGRILDAKGRVLAETKSVTSLVVALPAAHRRHAPEARGQPSALLGEPPEDDHQGHREPELPAVPGGPHPRGRERRDRDRVGRARERLPASVAREQLRACVPVVRRPAARGARGRLRRPHQPRGVRGAQGRRLRQRRRHREGRRREALRVRAARGPRARARCR